MTGLSFRLEFRGAPLSFTYTNSPEYWLHCIAALALTYAGCRRANAMRRAVKDFQIRSRDFYCGLPASVFRDIPHGAPVQLESFMRSSSASSSSNSGGSSPRTSSPHTSAESSVAEISGDISGEISPQTWNRRVGSPLSRGSRRITRGGLRRRPMLTFTTGLALVALLGFLTQALVPIPSTALRELAAPCLNAQRLKFDAPVAPTGIVASPFGADLHAVVNLSSASRQSREQNAGSEVDDQFVGSEVDRVFALDGHNRSHGGTLEPYKVEIPTANDLAREGVHLPSLDSSILVTTTAPDAPGIEVQDDAVNFAEDDAEDETEDDTNTAHVGTDDDDDGDMEVQEEASGVVLNSADDWDGGPTVRSNSGAPFREDEEEEYSPLAFDQALIWVDVTGHSPAATDMVGLLQDPTPSLPPTRRILQDRSSSSREPARDSDPKQERPTSSKNRLWRMVERHDFMSYLGLLPPPVETRDFTVSLADSFDPSYSECHTAGKISASAQATFHSLGIIVFIVVGLLAAWVFTIWLLTRSLLVNGCGSAPRTFEPTFMSIFLKILFGTIPLVFWWVHPITKSLNPIDKAGIVQRMSVTCLLAYISTLGLDIRQLARGIKRNHEYVCKRHIGRRVFGHASGSRMFW